MIVCVCRRVSHRDIESEVRGGCASFEELQDQLGVATACGSCVECAHETFERACAAHQASRPDRVIPIMFASAAPAAAAA